jgi:hypothetical protein
VGIGEQRQPHPKKSSVNTPLKRLIKVQQRQTKEQQQTSGDCSDTFSAVSKVQEQECKTFSKKSVMDDSLKDFHKYYYYCTI